ncbi:MAG: transaldolase [Psychromonas sp.]|nr:transaldolase [Psychromonas sp.]
MENKLDQLRKFTTVVADTGDIEAIKKYQPQDATTNPSLILKAAEIPAYTPFITEAIIYAKSQSSLIDQQVQDACDMLAVLIGKKILNYIPGRVSTEVNAKLSYDTKGSLTKARQLVKMYNDVGVTTDRILIKIAATWEGIRAAQVLEKEDINCNLTLLFSFAQAQACAQAGVFLISPFVGRIMDWYKKEQGCDFTAENDPGVISVTAIYNYYKAHGYNTRIMGASFRNIDEILALAGCDCLTISPEFLQLLQNSEDEVILKLKPSCKKYEVEKSLTQPAFLWAHNQDPMAVQKLAEGISNFATDQEKLESMILEKL